MVINATLLVQVLNFYIFYWLLRLLLFRPVVTIIEGETKDTTKIVDGIDQQRKSIEIKEKELQNYWQVSREYFRLQWPAYVQQAEIIHCDESDSADFNPTVGIEDINVLVTQVTERLKEKIQDVH